MTADIIGLDGRPLQLCGWALPYGEAVAGKPAVASGALNWSEDVPLVWEHDADHVIADGWRVELIDTARALFFAAVLPATAAAQHVANVASFGRLRVSIETNNFGAKVEKGVITKTRLAHIGLTTAPAHESTIVWRSDFEPSGLTPEQRNARNRFAVASMAHRARAYRPAPPPQRKAEVVRLATAHVVKRKNRNAPERHAARIANFARFDREIDEMNDLNRERRAQSALLAALAGQGSAPSRGSARPGFPSRPGRRPKCPVSGVKRT
jgi:hypothetical protein